MRTAKLALSACAAMLLIPSSALAITLPPPLRLIWTSTATVGTAPWGVAIDSATDTAFVSNYQSGTASVINASTGAQIHAPIPVGHNPEGVAVDPDTNTVYVANFGSDNLTAINTNTWQTNTIALPIGANLMPNSVAVDDATDTVYVGTYWSSTVDVINGATNTFQYDVAIKGANIHDVVVNQGNGDVLVSAYNENTVYTITPQDPTGLTLEAGGVCGPAGMAIDPTDGTLWVAQNYPCGENPPFGVFAFDTVGLSEPNTLSFAGSAAAPAYLAALPGGDAFASIPSTNSVEAVTGDSIVDTVAVGPDPMMLDVDPVTGDVIVADYGSDTVTIIYNL
jgi:YVTN family beta-propeller protein